MDRRRLIGGLGAAAALGVAAPATAARRWPDRPVTFVVPWAQGGGTDLHARLLASLLEKKLGQTFNVVNRTGARGLTGHQAIASADPDGTTFGFVTVEIVTLRVAGLTELSFRDFTPVSLLNVIPAGLHVRAGAPWRDLGQVMDVAKASPGRVRASGAPAGSIWHLALAGMLRGAGLEQAVLPWQPNRSTTRSLQDLVAGGVDVVSCALAEASTLIDSGQVQALAVMAERRNEKYRDVPTIKEAIGVDWSLASFVSLMGPRGLDPQVSRRLDEAVAEVTGSREWAEFLLARGFENSYRDAAGLSAHLDQVDGELPPLMRALGIAPV